MYTLNCAVQLLLCWLRCFLGGSECSDVINFRLEQGIITFTVPLDAPSLLFYQSETDINVGGAIEISTLDESFIFDVEKNLIGKQTFTLPNGQSLSNGMKDLDHNMRRV